MTLKRFVVLGTVVITLMPSAPLIHAQSAAFSNYYGYGLRATFPCPQSPNGTPQPGCKITGSTFSLKLGDWSLTRFAPTKDLEFEQTREAGSG